VNGGIGTGGLVVSMVLVVVAVVFSAVRGLGLERSILWASARALAQLLIVGSALTLVIDPDQPLVWSWAWVVGMIGFAAVTTKRRSPELPGILLIAAAAFAAATAVSLGVLLGLDVFPTTGRTVVPLAGMVVGNSLAATVLVCRRIVATFTDDRDEIEARLALGQAAPVAARPYVRAAVRTGLIPQIETTKSTGLVFLPGAMVGLILAGTDPAEAVKVQAAVMYLVLGSVATTTAVVALGASRRLVTSDHRLVRLVRRPG
jgi:putative ABC transport system permease protein